VKIDLSGADEMEAAIARVGDQAHRQQATMRAIADTVAEQTTRIPVGKTGNLSRSIKYLAGSGYFFAVGSDIPYSRYVREGTVRSKPHQYRVPRFAREAAEILSSRIIR